jgi:hypothetical protein
MKRGSNHKQEDNVTLFVAKTHDMDLNESDHHSSKHSNV